LGPAAKARADNLAALLFRLEQGQEDPAALVALIDEVIGWFLNHPDHAELKTLFTELVRQAIGGLEPTEPPVAIPAELTEMRTMLATQGERWITKWTAQGRAEGKAEGRAEGEAKGKADTLQRLLHRKFGDIPADVTKKIQAANIDQLDEWSDRILDAKTLDDVFE